MKPETRPAIERLLRGISTDHVETVRDAWRDLLADGAKSVPLIRDKLRSSAWKKPPRGPVSRYLGVLLCILDELEKAAFETEIDRLRKGKLHPLHARTLEVLSRRVDEAPAAHLACGVPLFVSADIPDRDRVVRNIRGWSGTTGVSLESVTRIDVIARQPDLEYLGKYNLFFSGIVLTWPTDPARGIKLWWRRLDAEFTFYHEVGHHVLGHVEGGQVAEQEQDADRYAASMMRRSRPVFTFVGRMLLWPSRPLLKRLIAGQGQARVAGPGRQSP